MGESCPNILKVKRYDTKPLPHIEMELCQKDLRTMIREKGRIPVGGGNKDNNNGDNEGTTICTRQRNNPRRH